MEVLHGHVRNIICQRRAAVNFDQLLNQRKILLANLSTGLLTEKVAGTSEHRAQREPDELARIVANRGARDRT